MNIVDFHAHCFPDSLAEHAVGRLAATGNIKPYLDGKISSLIASMDKAGIRASVVASIATKPQQFVPILEWSKQIASQRIFPFPSVHPEDPKACEHIETIRSEGFRGIKLHPFYQKFSIDEDRMFPLYETIEKCDLALLMHTGFDIAFPRTKIADPRKTLDVVSRFPALKFIATHLGAWEDWKESCRLLIGKRIYIDTAVSTDQSENLLARHILTTHPQEYLLFGSDSPWADQKEAIDTIKSFDLEESRLRCLLFDNAARLLGFG